MDTVTRHGKAGTGRPILRVHHQNDPRYFFQERSAGAIGAVHGKFMELGTVYLKSPEPGSSGAMSSFLSTS